MNVTQIRIGLAALGSADFLMSDFSSNDLEDALPGFERTNSLIAQEIRDELKARAR